MRLPLGLPVDTLGPARPAPAPRGFAAPVAHCGGRMKLRALVRDRESIERFLRHQNLWTERRPAASPRPGRRPTFAASPASSQPARPSCSSTLSAPPQDRGLPTERSLSDRLQVEGRGFILARRLVSSLPGLRTAGTKPPSRRKSHRSKSNKQQFVPLPWLAPEGAATATCAGARRRGSSRSTSRVARLAARRGVSPRAWDST